MLAFLLSMDDERRVAERLDAAVGHVVVAVVAHGLRRHAVVAVVRDVYKEQKTAKK